MNREVEERIVAMYFDNQDFEKNAKTTIDTLGQLKDSLNIGKDAERGFSVFEKISKTLNFDKANQGLTKMRSTLGNMKDLFKKVFNLGPIDDAYRALDRFKHNYFDRVLGFDIADKLVSGLENTFRQLTVAPISAGWGQYESKMDSVKTIMSSTGESMEVVEKHLQNMTEYANQTIYSLTDMTSNLGKFTNNGVKLEDAVAAMEGIANATAAAGQGSQQASMAMYNISQAMGVGKMTTIDWKSLENANIATVQLKETFLEMAAAQGKLRKETRQVGDEIKTSYWLETDEEGKKLKKAVELNANNFREYLSKGWLDKETMLRTFMLYSGEGIDQNTLYSWGVTELEEQKRLMKLGEEAREAATQVRTFTKMMDALKESVQSGWAESFQIIFGNMETGTQLWTSLNEKIDGVLSGITKKRNAALKEWAELDEEGKSIWTKDSDWNTVRREGVKSGRDILIESVFELMDVVQNLGSAISKTFTSVFGELDGKKLLDLTLKFRDLVNRIKEWFGSMDDYNSRISKLMRGLRGVLNIIKVVLRVVKAAANWIGKQLSPVIDWIIDKFAKLGDYFRNNFGNMELSKIPEYLGKVLKDIWNKIKAVFTPADGNSESPFVTWIKGVWAGFKKEIRNFGNQIGLGPALDALHEAWETVAGWWEDIKQALIDGWDKIKTWWEGSGIPGFFQGIWDSVVSWFTPETLIDANGNETKGNAPIVQFFLDIWTGIQEAFEGLSEWWDKSGIPEFFQGVWDSVTSLFKNSKKADANGHELKTHAPIVQFFLDIWEGLKSAYDQLSSWWDGSGIPEFFQGIWDAVSSLFEAPKMADSNGHELKTNAPIVQFFIDLWHGLEEAYTQLSEWWEGSGIPEFFKGIWDSVTSWFTPEKKADANGHELKTKAPIIQFFLDIWHGMEDAYAQLSKWWEGSGIPEFFKGIWDSVVSWFTPEKKADANGHELKTNAPIVQFFQDIWNGIQEIYENIKGWWESSEVQDVLQNVGEFFSNIWGWITSVFSGGSETATPETSTAAVEETAKDAEQAIQPTQQAVEFFERIVGAIGNFFDKIKNALGNMPIVGELTKFLEAVGNFFSGLMTMFTNILNSFGNIMQGKSSADDWVTLARVILPIIIIKIGQLLNNKYLSGIEASNSQNFAQKFLEIAGGLFLMAGAIAILTTLDEDKMLKCAGVLAGLGVIIGVITGIIAKMKATQIQDAAVTSGERILTSLIGAIGKIGMVSAVLALLPGVIKAIGDAKSSGIEALGSDTLQILEGVTILIGGISLVFGVLQKLTGDKGMDPLATLKTVISVAEVIGVVSAVILAVGGIGEAVDGVFGAGSHEAVIAALEKAAEFLRGIGYAVNQFFSGLLGMKSESQKTEEALNQFDLIADASEKFTSDKVAGVSRMATLLSSLTSGNLNIDTGKLTNFAEAMGKFGAGIYEYARYLNLEDLNNILTQLADPSSEIYQKMVTFTDFGKRLGDMVGALSNFNVFDTLYNLNTLAGAENVEQFVNDLQVMLNALGRLNAPDEGISFDGLTIATKLVQAIQDGLIDPSLPKFDATSVVDAIVDAIKLGNTNIALLVHEMVQNGLDLSASPNGPAGGLTLSDDTKQAIQGIFGTEGDLFKTFDMDGLKEQLYGKDGNGGILGEMTKFQNQMPSLASMFENKGWMDFKDENGEPIDVLGEVQSHLTELGDTLNNMDPLKVTITPVFDWKNLSVDSMQKELLAAQLPLPMVGGITGLGDANVRIDFSGLEGALNLEGIRTKLENVVTAIITYGGNAATAVSGLASHMDGIAAEVSRMKLILDTGVLVGQISPMIDVELQRRSLVTDRTGG